MNDSSGFQNAVDDLPNGGTILVDGGVWDLQGGINFVTSNVNSFVIQGDKGAIIRPDMSAAMFYFGNQNQVDIRDLILVGDGTKAADFDYAFYFSGGAQAKIAGCQFFGVKATYSLIYASGTDVVIKDTLFHGPSSSVAVIEAVNSRGMTVTDSEFFDYGNLSGTYYSKTPYGVGHWIKVSDAAFPTPNAIAQRGVIISNVRFDEGALSAINLANIKYASISNISVNVAGVDGATGIALNNVRLAQVNMSTFGYTTASRPAMTLINGSRVQGSGITLGGGVAVPTTDSSSVTYLSLCDGCY